MEGRNMISMFVPDKAKIKEFTKKLDQERRRQEQELKRDSAVASVEQPQKVQ
jgi:hypothetical protein